MSALANLGQDARFWIRLEYKIADRDPTSNPDDNSTFTLRTLIDMLSRRQENGELADSMEAGPFGLPD